MNQRKHFSTKTSGRYRYARYRNRLAVAVMLSLLTHVFMLSLQFGLPGLGLPGLDLPWDQRRAQPSGLSVMLSTAKHVAEPATPVEIASSTPAEHAQLPDHLETPIATAPSVHAAGKRASRPNTSIPQPFDEATRSADTIAKSGRKSAAPRAPNREQPTGSRAGARIIAQTDAGLDTFAVMPRLFDEPDQTKTSRVDRRPEIFERTPQESVVIPDLEDPTALARDQMLAEQKRAEEEATRAREAEAKKQEELRQAQELEVRRLAEEETQRQAAALALQAEQKRVEEKNVRRAQDLEANRLDELKRLEQAKAERQVQELATRKQAEEAARQAELKRQEEENVRRAQELDAKRLEELKRQEQAKAERQAQELAVRKQAEEAARQAELKHRDEENIRRAQELEAKRLEELKRQEQTKAERQAQELAARKQAEEAARQAELKRQDEENARRAQELEAKKRAELQLQEDARHRAMELEAKTQAEETARRQAAERQKQAEEQAAREKAEAEARRQAEAAAAARQRERQAADRRNAAGNETSQDVAGLPVYGAGGGSAGKALEQVQKSDALRITPQVSRQLPESVEQTRRRSIFGRVDQDVGLMMYVDSWRQKIERNGRLNYKQSLVDTAYTEPIVTVAIRSDGSIENIFFDRRSGRGELDEAVQRIIRLNARYGAFPPELARRYDVIEIRRVWNFDDKLRLLEDVR